ncbi:acyl carrier protein [Erysipelotrichaceae bacterium OH741_COT-311]|nr:acyl carrier protein [Erysipelotrichaceae bacterium OH741_COT-311]
MNNLEIISTLINTLKGMDRKIYAEDSFEMLGIDSFELFELCLLIEDRLNITFNEEELMQITCVYDILKLIEGRS